MKQYRKELEKRRNWLLIALSIIVIILSTNRYLNLEIIVQNKEAADFMHGLFAGTVVGIELVLVVMMIRIVRALGNDAALEKLYIEETDERMAFIRNKIGGTFATFMTFFQIIIAIALAFVDIRFTMVLYAVTAVECIIRLAMKAWYMKTI